MAVPKVRMLAAGVGIPTAVTPNESIGMGSRPLQLLQVEDSDRYRSNIGIVEVTGQPALVEITVYPPDSRTFVRTRVPMQGNGFRQMRLLRELGLGDTYNARVAIKVVEGQGRITAYSSVIDMQTQDPTYNQAQ